MKNNVPIMVAGIIVGIIIVIVGGVLLFNSMRSPSTELQTSPSTATSPTQTPDEQLATVNVSIKNRAFSPKTITVKKGTTVVWKNEDTMGHNVVSDNGALPGGPPNSAPLLANNETFTFTFNTVGVFPYHCAPHPDMTGTVEVIE